jgi:cellulose synthase/poly-beta-1,6-N-acetylglucosamine synthase-like glycosyltransferase
MLDYPNYRLRIVIDSETDPVIADVDALVATRRAVPIDVCYLGERLRHCMGKPGAVLRATQDLDPDIEVVAFFDGDALVHASCLRELVAPLADRRIGVTSGNRWYMPRSGALGGLMRTTWNGYAVGVMNMLHIPWGGCMALRAEHLREPAYRAALEHSFAESSATKAYMRDRDLEVRFVSDATLISRDEISVRDLYKYLVRQLLNCRLGNHYHWSRVFMHSLVLNGTLVLGLVLPWCEALQPAALLGACILAAVTVAEILIACRLARATAAKHGIQVPGMAFRQLITLPLYAVGTLLMSLAATLHVPFVRRIAWRGITYWLGDPPKITVVDVAPVVVGPAHANSHHPSARRLV